MTRASRSLIRRASISRRPPVELLWNGEIIDRGVTGAADGPPVRGARLAANLLASRDRGMGPGEIVITGSALKTRFPEAGDEVVYRIAGLGQTTVAVT